MAELVEHWTGPGVDAAWRAIEAGRVIAMELRAPPVTTVVVDAGGHVVAAERADGAGFGTYALALGKARLAVALGCDSKQLVPLADDHAGVMSGVVAAIGPPAVPAAGGVPIERAGLALGAVGVSGADATSDDAIARAAADAAFPTMHGPGA